MFTLICDEVVQFLTTYVEMDEGLLDERTYVLHGVGWGVIIKSVPYAIGVC